MTRFRSAAFVLVVLVSGCASTRSSAPPSCSTSCPEGSRYVGKQCVWDEARVACPKGSSFRGKECVPSVRTGQVDVQRIIEMTEYGRSRKQELRKDFEKKQKKLDEDQARLTEEKKIIDSGKLSKGAHILREKKFVEALSELQATYLRFQEDLKSREQALLGELLNDVRLAAGAIGEHEGFAAIFTEQDTLWVSSKHSGTEVSLRGIPRVDLTEIVARELDRTKSGSGGKSP